VYGAVVDDRVALKMGPGAWVAGPGWKLCVQGNDFKVWEREHGMNW
jgi:alpha-amylase